MAVRRHGGEHGAPEDQTTLHDAAVFKELRAQGTPIPTTDMHRAALILRRNAALHDRDAHVDHPLPLVRL